MDRGDEGSVEHFRWLYASVDDAGPLEERWHEDLVVRQSPDLPGTAGVFEGYEGLRAVQRELRESYDDIVWDPQEVRSLGGGRYAVRVRVSATGHGSGIPLADELGHRVELRDGRIVALDVYMSWESLLEAVEPA